MKTTLFKFSTVVLVSAVAPWGFLFGDHFAPGRARAHHVQLASAGAIFVASAEASSARRAAVNAGRDGAFHADALINGKPIDMIVDTGASIVVLREEDAAQIGLHLLPSDFTRKLQTANGMIMGAEVVLRDISIGGVAESNVEAVVIPRNLSTTSLLGRSFTGRVKIEASGDRMLISQ